MKNCDANLKLSNNMENACIHPCAPENFRIKHNLKYIDRWIWSSQEKISRLAMTNPARFWFVKLNNDVHFASNHIKWVSVRYKISHEFLTYNYAGKRVTSG